MLLFQATLAADSTQVAADKLLKQAIADADGLDKLSLITQQLIDFGIRAGERILIAVVVFIVGRFLISLLNKFVVRLMEKRKVDISIKTFVRSLVNILLTILLIISVVGALGVETTSFAALLASAGVAVGMALSGNLQNFAGGLIVLLFKPYKVGDLIESQNVIGTVNAMACADMAMAGITSRIPPDQVMDAMKEVGDKMDASLRETALGGLARTEEGVKIAEKMHASQENW